jgi:UDP-N-acetylmuramoyl-tripeptide--D-alanyl-D-alanine ligase
MKRIFKQPVASLLALLAHLIVRKYKPTVVMVTGSVGKTSTKDALKATLGERSYVRASEKSYNSEFGVPLTIIGARNPWTNPFSWLLVYKEALALLLLPNHYPKMLVLEVGADRPGDLEKILHIALPSAVVVTRLPEVPVHVEAYATPEAVREEEFVPAYGLAPQAPLVVNAEDEYALAYAKRLPVSLVTFGFKEKADVFIQHPKAFTEKKVVAGMEAVFTVGEENYPVRVVGALGNQQLLAPAAAFAAALALGVDAKDALKGLESYVPPPGRARILPGKAGSVIIDDSYNASPVAAVEALNSLCLVHAERHIAVLGDMLELGRYSVAEHEQIGALAATCATIVVAVGVRARTLADAAKKAGMKEGSVYTSDNAKAAAELLLGLVQKGDVILVKGSQSIRTERIVEALLANPADVSKLVRQEKVWKRR